MIRELISLTLLFLGTLLMILAGIGLLRMPDLFLRMSAATKGSTLGAGLSLIAVAVHFGDLGVTTRAIAIFLFLLLTAPVAAHMMGRAAYADQTPLWEGTRCNHLEGQYDSTRNTLNSYPIPNEEDELEVG